MTTARQNNNSWFTAVRNLCLQYSLPHPLTILRSPPSRNEFKKLVKSRVIDYWEKHLRADASLLPSLVYFHPQYMSLSQPHPLWWTAGANPYEVAKAVVQARMVSGRYRTRQLTSKWGDGQSSFCPLPECDSQTENLEHVLIHCPSYSEVRSSIVLKWKANHNTAVAHFISYVLTQPHVYLMQFLLDATSLPDTQRLISIHGSDILPIIFSLTRTWCYSIHRERLQLFNELV